VDLRRRGANKQLQELCAAALALREPLDRDRDALDAFLVELAAAL
jgi:hypothetical protein